MAISDNNPDRRNLNLLAVSIIVYFFAGGQLTDDNVRLHIINVTFNNPEVLTFFIWGLLIWFLYRYWLTNKNSWKEGFYSEAKCSLISKYSYSYLVKKFGLSNDYSNSFYPDKHWVYFGTAHHEKKFYFAHILKDNEGKQKHEYKDVETITDRILVLITTVITFFSEPSLSTYFIPYLLTLIAIALGVNSAL
ncbi:hypothetical protein THMIRHAM_10290 [Thiomicrorhabdus immobilis]|uniref:Uncharacterized protein n=1 Tax=Thiomicrorhabdus immobilis TaxID=2791037 RepID=A0ABM7MCV6_9GAMM|nr:hypothetical protein [Thiomicrorhabdus immobilis]BCN93244.1 hypothetical protein THMIRHAM_10290 [Thiomicrorhabdus immobilis]